MSAFKSPPPTTKQEEKEPLITDKKLQKKDVSIKLPWGTGLGFRLFLRWNGCPVCLWEDISTDLPDFQHYLEWDLTIRHCWEKWKRWQNMKSNREEINVSYAGSPRHVVTTQYLGFKQTKLRAIWTHWLSICWTTNEIPGRKIYLNDVDFKLYWPTLLLLHLGRAKGRGGLCFTPSCTIVFSGQNKKEVRLDSSIDTHYVSL